MWPGLLCEESTRFETVRLGDSIISPSEEMAFIVVHRRRGRNMPSLAPIQTKPIMRVLTPEKCEHFAGSCSREQRWQPGTGTLGVGLCTCARTPNDTTRPPPAPAPTRGSAAEMFCSGPRRLPRRLFLFVLLPVAVSRHAIAMPPQGREATAGETTSEVS